MVEHQKTSQNNKEDAEQKRRLKQKESQPSFDHFHAWEQRVVSVAETPFWPRMDEHAKLLAMPHPDEARASLVSHLQQTYGNSYVQRLMKSTGVQAKLTVNAPNDVYEQEADRVADAVTKSVTSQAQPQMEDEEELTQMKASGTQRQELPEEEKLQAKSLLQRQDMLQDEEIQMQVDDNQPAILSEYLQTSSTSTGQMVIQREWAPEDVNEALKKGAAGVRSELKRGGYTIYKFDTLRIKKRVDGEESEGSLHGYHCRAHRMIGIKADETSQAAAATIVHETQHAQQYEERTAGTREDFDILKREYEAHIREEEFRKAHDEPPKIPEFRDESGNIDKTAIKEWIRSNYSRGSVRRYYPSGHPKADLPISSEDLKHIHNLSSNPRQVNIW